MLLRDRRAGRKANREVLGGFIVRIRYTQLGRIEQNNKFT